MRLGTRCLLVFKHSNNSNIYLLESDMPASIAAYCASSVQSSIIIYNKYNNIITSAITLYASVVLANERHKQKIFVCCETIQSYYLGHRRFQFSALYYFTPQHGYLESAWMLGLEKQEL